MSFAHRPTSTSADDGPRSVAEQQLRVDLAAAYGSSRSTAGTT